MHPLLSLAAGAVVTIFQDTPPGDALAALLLLLTGAGVSAGLLALGVRWLAAKADMALSGKAEFTIVLVAAVLIIGWALGSHALGLSLPSCEISAPNCLVEWTALVEGVLLAGLGVAHVLWRRWFPDQDDPFPSLPGTPEPAPAPNRAARGM